MGAGPRDTPAPAGLSALRSDSDSLRTHESEAYEHCHRGGTYGGHQLPSACPVRSSLSRPLLWRRPPRHGPPQLHGGPGSSDSHARSTGPQVICWLPLATPSAQTPSMAARTAGTITRNWWRRDRHARKHVAAPTASTSRPMPVAQISRISRCGQRQAHPRRYSPTMTATAGAVQRAASSHPRRSPRARCV